MRAFAATARRGAREVRGHPVLLLLLGVAFTYGAWTESFDRLWVAQFLSIGLPDALRDVTTIGLLTGVAFLAGIVTSELAARRLGEAPSRTLARVLTALNVGLLISALAFSLVGSFALACGAYLGIVALRSLVGPLQSVWINRTIVDSSVRATTLSMVSQADAVGQVVGGPAIGGLATAVSLRAGLAVGALMLVPAALLTRTARSRLAAPESAPNDS